MRSIWSLVVTAAVLGASAKAGYAQQGPVKGPELDILKAMEGTWDAEVKFAGQANKGVMTYKMGLGGLWLMSSFEGEFFGQKFEGHGMDSYDAVKKKYVSVWVDSMASAPLVMEGTYDKAKSTLTLAGEGPGMDGKVTKAGMITEFKGPDTMVSSMSGPGPDGKDAVMMTITYKRKK